MTELAGLLQTFVDEGTVPGAVAMVARGGSVEVAAVGWTDLDRTSPMQRDTVFRIASITKPVTAAAACVLVDDGRIALGDPVAQWLPELAAPSVVRSPGAAVDDVVPADRPITVADLLESRCGYGFPDDFSLPAVALLWERAQKHGRDPQRMLAPDAWLATLASVPMLRQPGDAWLYNTSYDILGVLVARASGRPFPEFLAERLFEPLGMADTGFAVPA